MLAVMLPVGCVDEKDLRDKSTPCPKAKTVDRETALQMVLAMPEVKALELAFIENNGIGISPVSRSIRTLPRLVATLLCCASFRE